MSNPDVQTIAITGVGGFIGLRIAERAVQLGMNVKGVELSASAGALAEHAGASVEIADLCAPEVAARLCHGADIVVHTAARIDEGNDWSAFRRLNVAGTEGIVEAAKRAGVRRFVHLSSVMVYGFNFPDQVTEDGPLVGENNPYCQTKIESEEVVLRAHEPGAMEVVILRPGDVYGPRSSPWVVRPLALIRRHLMVLPSGGSVINHVYIDNLVDALWLALEKNITGQAFNITDDQPTPAVTYFGYLAHMLGHRPPMRFPAALLRVLFFIIDTLARALSLRSPASPAAVSFVNRTGAYSIDKARKLLQYEPKIDLDTGMAAVRKWLQESNSLPPRQTWRREERPIIRFERSTRELLWLHVGFTALCTLVMYTPLPIQVGEKLLLLTILYNAALPLLGTLRGHQDWLDTWRVIFTISVFMVFPDWFLVSVMETLAFPANDGVFHLGPVSGYMVGLWVIPLFPLVYVAQLVDNAYGPRFAYAVAVCMSLFVFGGSEQFSVLLGSWRAVSVNTMIDNIAVYVLISEAVLGAAVLYVFRQLKGQPFWFVLLTAPSVAVFYTGTLACAYLLIEKLAQ